MYTIRIAVFAAIVSCFAILPRNANGQMPVQQLKVTLSQPVEVPNLVLPAGTYIFEALENGRMTRILNANESHVFTTLLTQPEERLEPADHATVTFWETPRDQVARIDAWFSPGESIGNQFLYPGNDSAGKLDATLSGAMKDAGHVIAEAAEDIVLIPEHAAVHVEHAIVGSSVATGRFFRANFLVN